MNARPQPVTVRRRSPTRFAQLAQCPLSVIGPRRGTGSTHLPDCGVWRGRPYRRRGAAGAQAVGIVA